jgi:hypothetical protein
MINNAGLGLGDNDFLEALDAKKGEGRKNAAWVVSFGLNLISASNLTY